VLCSPLGVNLGGCAFWVAYLLGIYSVFDLFLVVIDDHSREWDVCFGGLRWAGILFPGL
jgi:hypothetical protein